MSSIKRAVIDIKDSSLEVTGDNILVWLHQIEPLIGEGEDKKTKGGILLPGQVGSNLEISSGYQTSEGIVQLIGPNVKKRDLINRRVIFSTFAGHPVYGMDNLSYRILKEDDLLICNEVKEVN